MKIELSKSQKEFITEYLLNFNKGLIECDEFWEDISQEYIDKYIDDWRDAIHEFIEEAKEQILKSI